MKRLRKIAILPIALLAFADEALAQDAGVTTVLDAVTVSGQRSPEAGDGPVEGYKAKTTRSASKTDTEIRDLPQSINVISRSVIEDSGASRVEKALEVAGGVTKQNNFGGLTMYEYAVRGFVTSEFYRDGLSVNRGYAANPDSVNIERVEVLKGPAGALYGRGDPGGTVNLITKQPRHDPHLEVSGQAGSFDSYRSTLDATGPLSVDKAWLYRVTMAAEDNGSFRDHVEGRRIFLAPSLAWDAGPNTLVRLEGELLRGEQTFDRGVLAVNNKLGAIPISRFLGEPDDKIRNNNEGIKAIVQHGLDPDWSLRLAGDFKSGRLWGQATESWALLADNRTLNRRNRYRDYSWNDAIAQAELTGHFETAGIGHTLLLGAEYETYRKREILNRSANGMPIDIYNPVYGQARLAYTSFANTLENVDSQGLFIQDQVAVTRQVKIQAGLRYDNFNQTLTERIGNTRADQTRSAISPRGGIIYQPIDEVGLFANAGRSFRPNPGATAAYRPFLPEKGVGYETGVKLDLLDRRLGVTAALFHITPENVLVNDPANAGFQIAAGGARSRGFDMNVVGQITPALRLIGGYAYVDAKITEGTTPAPGTRLVNVPRHAAGLQSIYEFQDQGLRGLGIGAGMNLVSARAGDGSGTGFELPGYATFDALVYFEPFENLRLGLNVYNLFDAEIYERSYDNRWVAPGAPRTVLGSVKVKF